MIGKKEAERCEIDQAKGGLGMLLINDHRKEIGACDFKVHVMGKKKSTRKKKVE